MNRTENLKKLKTEEFDICIIGAGASGTGCALDATLRGYKVALIDKNDFAAETSSRSTKLIHGGVRYLEQAFKNLDFAQLKQVKHGLEERHTVLRNAPHLAQPLALITPVRSWIEGLYFTIGLKIYGWFAKNDPLPTSQWLSKKEAFDIMPTLNKRTHSAVMYYDGQLDDARYCLALAQSASEAGAVVVNHVEVTGFEKDNNGKLLGVRVLCHESCVMDNRPNKGTIMIESEQLENQKTDPRPKIQDSILIKAKIFINCTGPHADAVRQMANPVLETIIRPSKGVHLMLPKNILSSEAAMLIPKTPDGRVVFVIPFEGETMVGTTDTDYDALDQEPILESDEIDYLLDTLAPYINQRPDRSQVRAGFGGLRPLIKSGATKSTKKLVRDHEVEHDEASNLVSLLGGKWTTYRLMAKDTIDKIDELFEQNNKCTTAEHLLVGAVGYDFENWKNLAQQYDLTPETAQHLLKKYGNRAEKVLDLLKENKHWKSKLTDSQPYIQAEVVYQVRNEMACTPRDVLARRMRLELKDWQTTLEVLPTVANLMQPELGWSDAKKEAQIEKYQLELQKFIRL
jgi:glycerol-3-phosphate dehydrogenase